MVKDEAWVTFALSETDCIDALVLAKSIKRTLSTKRLVVLTSTDVSKKMRYLLWQEFNFVLEISETLEDTEHLANAIKENPHRFAVFTAWRLTAFQKCVFLNPKILLLHHSDKIFAEEDLSATYDVDGIVPNVIVLNPSAKRFNELVEYELNFVNGKDTLNHFFSKWNNSEKNSLSHEWNFGPDSFLNCEERNFALTEGYAKHGNTHWTKELILKNTASGLSTWEEVYTREVISMLFGIENVGKLDKLPVNVPEVMELDNFEDAIAVVGMSCRFPGANNSDEFWDLLKDGTSVIRPFPSERPSHNGPGLTYNIHAGFLNCAVDEFDAQFFGISPREAPFIDPQQRLLLEVTYEGLENAGINPQTLRDTDVGVFMGVWQPDYDRLLHMTTTTESDFFHRYLGNAFSATASRVNFFMGFRGPAVALESGCSSSLGAIHLACESLRKNETSLAISSGVNLILIGANPFMGNNKDEKDDSVVLSKDFMCKTFDASANGFVRAEGCGVLILKRYVEAKSDGDRILGVIRGSAMNNDGTSTSFGTPNPDAQEEVFHRALRNAKVEPSEVSFLEAHGTGTPVGDPIEIEAVGRVYSRNRTKPLIISSVKTNIGHCEAASGIASVIKAILCLQHEQIPPHLNLVNLNPRIDLASIPAIIPMELMPWEQEPRICAVSSFSMTATNVHVILQQTPKHVLSNRYESPISQESPTPVIITVSAKSKEALLSLTKSYVQFLEESPNVLLADFAFAANVGRAHFPHRLAIIASTVAELIDLLKREQWTYKKIATGKIKVAYLFPGQGSQYFGMTRELASQFPVFQKALERGCQIFKQYLHVSLFDVLWTDSSLLERSLYCQPAIVAVEFAIMELWKSFGVKPDVVLGHSLGEIGAAICASILTLEEGMRLIIVRCILVDRLAPEGEMLAITTDLRTIEEHMRNFCTSSESGWIDVAAVNAEEEVVVSGSVNGIREFKIYCEENGLTTTHIPASHAFHSRDMDRLIEEYGWELKQIFSTRLSKTATHSSVSFLSATDGKFKDSGDLDIAYWKRHLRNPVQFSKACCFLRDEYKVLVEVGPQPILLGLAMRNLVSTEEFVLCPSVRRTEPNITTFLTSVVKTYMAGVNVNWRGLTLRRQNYIQLPNYPWQRISYWFTTCDEEETKIGWTGGEIKLHPLLGIELVTACSTKVYGNVLRTHDLPYLLDHKVAGITIYPAAAYLETLLAAAREILQSGGTLKFPLVVENFTIEAPLNLEKHVVVQTLVEQPEASEAVGIQYHISLHRRIPGGEFKRNASGKYIPSCNLPVYEAINLNELLGRLELRDGVVERVYSAIGKRGIEFGAHFQSIKSAWSSASEVLTELNYIPAQEAPSNYVCHPILLDALIQTHAFRMYLTTSTNSSSDTEKTIYLPVEIRRITWLPAAYSKVLYAYSSSKGKLKSTVALINNLGQPLVIMEDVELIGTTAQTVFNSLKQETSHKLKLSHEIWRLVATHATGSFQSTSIKHFETVDSSASSLVTIAAKCNREQVNFVDMLKELDKLLFLSILKVILVCGWPYVVGETVQPEYWETLLHKSVPKQVVKFYINELELHGYLKMETFGEERRHYKVITALGSLQHLNDRIQHILDIFLNTGDPTVTLLALWGKKFSEEILQVFQGKMTPLQYHFPSDESKLGALRFYSENPFYMSHCEVAIDFILQTASSLQGLPLDAGYGNGVKATLRILEVGCGGGTGSKILISKLKEAGIHFEYTCTDISPLLLAESKKSLGDEVKYCIFDLEKNSLSQGFLPNSFDIVLAFQVLHATRDLFETVENIRQVLHPGGKFVFTEMTEKVLAVSYPFSLLDGWWRFSDFRKHSLSYSPNISKEEWTDLLKTVGFYDILIIDNAFHLSALVATKCTKTAHSSNTKVCIVKPYWIIIEDGTSFPQKVARILEEGSRKVMLIPPTRSTKKDNIIQCSDTYYETLLKTMQDKDVEGILFFWTTNDENTKKSSESDQHIFCGGLLSLFKSYITAQAIQKTFKPKLRVVTRGVTYIGDDEVANPNKATLWGLTKAFRNECQRPNACLVDFGRNSQEFEAEQLFSILWTDNPEELVAFRGERLFTLRFVEQQMEKREINLPNTDRYQFINPTSGNFKDISIGPAATLEVSGKDVEVQVRACSLNFKDIICVLKPPELDISAKQTEAIGIDISGTVSRVGQDVTRFRVGDEVLGWTTGCGLASHAVTTEAALFHKSKHFTYTEAAGLPAVYVTGIYSLIRLARIRAGDRILIHVASGGVGLAAINIVRDAGGDIFATAGTKRKRTYLRSLGLRHVYSSRNLEFSQQILEDTNGIGVDVVLNSLTSPGFKEATLSATAPHGRFVEIAKLNIWSKAEVRVLRPDVEYHVVELVDVDFDNDTNFIESTNVIEAKMKTSSLWALPSKVFPLNKIHTAFQYFQEVKQIGKVVIKMPFTEIQPESGKLVHYNQPFHPESTYLITGGLGGIGLEMTKWMFTKGAKSIILVGRNQPMAAAKMLIRKLETSCDCKIIVVAMDVGFRKNCKRLIKLVSEFAGVIPPLRGIFHAAGIIRDDAIENQSWEAFEDTLRPKAFGGWHLHQLTLGMRLEFFILFSSAASCFGSLGQSPHATANSYLDSLAIYRHSLGLPATSINWGLWLNVGAGAMIANELESRLGLKGFLPSEGLQALEQILTETEPQVGFVPVRDWGLTKHIFSTGHYLNEVTYTLSADDSYADFAKKVQEIKESSKEERQSKIQICLERIIKDTLRLPLEEALDPDQNLSELGVDSLMAMEMKTRLQQLVDGRTIPVTALQENRTVRKLSTYLTNMINADEEPPLPPLEEILQIDAILPQEIQSMSLTSAVMPSQVKEIFLTGITGHFGAHLLPEIQNINKNLTTYCLIRASSDEEAEKLLISTLKYFDLHRSVDLSKVIPIAGDICKDLFGLTEEKYISLCENVDAVFHCAAKANHIEKYFDGTSTDIRSVNVIGLTRVLKFACTARMKRVFYTSTLMCVTEMDKDGELPERWIHPDSFDIIQNGYLQSKCIAEHLLSEASNRGLPCTVFRIPLLMSCSTTGIPTRSLNHVWNFLMAGIQIRKFPFFEHSGGLLVFPVDVAAKICGEIFLKDDSETGVYNITNDKEMTNDEMQLVGKEYGIDFEFVPFEDWRKEVFEDLDESVLGPLLSFYEPSVEGVSKVFSFHPLSQAWNKAAYKGFSPKSSRNLPWISETANYSVKEVFGLQLLAYGKYSKMKKRVEISQM